MGRPPHNIEPGSEVAAGRSRKPTDSLANECRSVSQYPHNPPVKVILDRQYSGSDVDVRGYFSTFI